MSQNESTAVEAIEAVAEAAIESITESAEAAIEAITQTDTNGETSDAGSAFAQADDDSNDDNEQGDAPIDSDAEETISGGDDLTPHLPVEEDTTSVADTGAATSSTDENAATA